MGSESGGERDVEANQLKGQYLVRFKHLLKPFLLRLMASWALSCCCAGMWLLLGRDIPMGSFYISSTQVGQSGRVSIPSRRFIPPHDDQRWPVTAPQREKEIPNNLRNASSKKWVIFGTYKIMPGSFRPFVSKKSMINHTHISTTPLSRHISFTESPSPLSSESKSTSSIESCSDLIRYYSKLLV